MNFKMRIFLNAITVIIALFFFFTSFDSFVGGMIGKGILFAIIGLVFLLIDFA